MHKINMDKQEPKDPFCFFQPKKERDLVHQNERVRIKKYTLHLNQFMWLQTSSNRFSFELKTDS